MKNGVENEQFIFNSAVFTQLVDLIKSCFVYLPQLICKPLSLLQVLIQYHFPHQLFVPPNSDVRQIFQETAFSFTHILHSPTVWWRHGG